MAITEKKRKQYIESLYSKRELKQIKNSVIRKRMEMETAIQDYLLLDERYRILKKHFKLTDKEENEIVDKYRVPSKGDKC